MACQGTATTARPFAGPLRHRYRLRPTCRKRGHDKSCTLIHATLDVSRTHTNEESVAGRLGATVGPASVVELSG
jgi:hypothetical protein